MATMARNQMEMWVREVGRLQPLANSSSTSGHITSFKHCSLLSCWSGTSIKKLELQ